MQLEQGFGECAASLLNEMAAGFGSFVLLEHAVENEHQLFTMGP